MLTCIISRGQGPLKGTLEPLQASTGLQQKSRIQDGAGESANVIRPNLHENLIYIVFSPASWQNCLKRCMPRVGRLRAKEPWQQSLWTLLEVMAPFCKSICPIYLLVIRHRNIAENNQTQHLPKITPLQLSVPITRHPRHHLTHLTFGTKPKISERILYVCFQYMKAEAQFPAGLDAKFREMHGNLAV